MAAAGTALVEGTHTPFGTVLRRDPACPHQLRYKKLLLLFSCPQCLTSVWVYWISSRSRCAVRPQANAQGADPSISITFLSWTHSKKDALHCVTQKYTCMCPRQAENVNFVKQGLPHCAACCHTAVFSKSSWLKSSWSKSTNRFPESVLGHCLQCDILCFKDPVSQVFPTHR